MKVNYPRSKARGFYARIYKNTLPISQKRIYYKERLSFLLTATLFVKEKAEYDFTCDSYYIISNAVSTSFQELLRIPSGLQCYESYLQAFLSRSVHRLIPLVL